MNSLCQLVEEELRRYWFRQVVSKLITHNSMYLLDRWLVWLTGDQECVSCDDGWAQHAFCVDMESIKLPSPDRAGWSGEKVLTSC